LDVVCFDRGGRDFGLADPERKETPRAQRNLSTCGSLYIC
jgi:hypothetical protein